MQMDIAYIVNTLHHFRHNTGLPVSIFGENPKLPKVAQYTVLLLTLSLGLLANTRFQKFHYIGKIPDFMTGAISKLTQHVHLDCTGTIQLHSTENTISVRTLLAHMQSTLRHKLRETFLRSEVEAAYPDQETADEIVKKNVASDAANRILLRAKIVSFRENMQPIINHHPTHPATKIQG